MLTMVKDLFYLVSGTKKFKMTPKKAVWETEIGCRFGLNDRSRPPWVASSQRMEVLRIVFRRLRFLKLPGRGYECPFTGSNRSITLTLSQLAMLTGDVGVWLMVHLDIEPDQKMTAVRYLYMLNFTTLKEHDPDCLDDLHLYVIETLTMAEMFFPIT
jgi:hypothetical protein